MEPVNLQTNTVSIGNEKSKSFSRKKRKFDIVSKEEEERLEKLIFGESTSIETPTEIVTPSIETIEIDPTSVVNTPPHLIEPEGENKRTPAWTDEDDLIAVGDALDCQNRKLPNGGINSRDGKYLSLLKHKFTELVGPSTWADLDRSDNKSDSDDEVLQTCGFLKKSNKLHLPSKTIELKKLLNLNHETENEGPQISCVEFHPTSSVALVAGKSGIVSLFSVDGKKNSKLHNVAIEKFPVHCAKFSKDGNEAILGSCRKHIFSYDLLAAKAVRINLPKGITQFKNFVISPDGKFIALAGKWGEVHIFSSTTKECLYMLKQQGEVSSLSFSPSGNYLYGHGDLGEVTVWDLNTRRVKHKWSDEGCLHGTSIDVSQSNQFLATGSAEGVVNIYDVDKMWETSCPTPRKSVLNLTTSISAVKFNPTSEILTLFSSELENSIRLLHLGTNSIFQNFPSYLSQMGNIHVANFSPGSGYFALGNKKSRVSLFRLKHYKSY